VTAVAVIHDADAPLLLALMIAAAIIVAPNLETILAMAATSAAIGVTVHAAVALVRLARRSARRAVPQHAP
jgi:hypothetical protein